MKPNDSRLLKLLSNNEVTFFIPPYQRNYEWDESQCEVFFDDVLRICEARRTGELLEHFFGMFVYVPSDDSVFGQPCKLILVDGQQRITTTMIFLIALRDAISDDGMKQHISQRYLRNDNVSGDSEYKVKLKQVETDWPAFRNLVLQYEVADEEKGSCVYTNYLYFKRRLKKLVESGFGELSDLASKGLEFFNVVTIELDPIKNPWENPQEIFESMNSLGKPLSLADLVRNWLLLGQSAEEQDLLYGDYWLPMEKSLGGTNGKMSDFIRDFMQMKEATDFKKATTANHKSLYAKFKKIFLGTSSKDLLAEMKKSSYCYALLAVDGCLSGSAKVDSRLFLLRKIEATVAYSFILSLLVAWKDNRMSEDRLVEILDVFNVYIFRRRILQLPQGENKALPRLSRYVESLCGSEDVKTDLLELLCSQGYRLRLPNNHELVAHMENMNFYSFKYSKLLLCLVEQALTKSLPSLEDKSLQLEHIMPRVLNDAWRAELGNEADAVHERLVDGLGNITLIRHNQELGNKAFAIKKEIYEGNSGLQVARTKIIDTDKWDEEKIIARSKWLASFIAENVVPIPKQIFVGEDEVIIHSQKRRCCRYGSHRRFHSCSRAVPARCTP